MIAHNKKKKKKHATQSKKKYGRFSRMNLVSSKKISVINTYSRMPFIIEKFNPFYIEQ